MHHYRCKRKLKAKLFVRNGSLCSRASRKPPPHGSKPACRHLCSGTIINLDIDECGRVVEQIRPLLSSLDWDRKPPCGPDV